MAKSDDNKICYCSFCKKPSNKVRKLIAGPNSEVFICDECVEVCADIIEEEFEEYEEESPKPKKKKHLLYRLFNGDGNGKDLLPEPEGPEIIKSLPLFIYRNLVIFKILFLTYAVCNGFGL